MSHKADRQNYTETHAGRPSGQNNNYIHAAAAAAALSVAIASPDSGRDKR